MAKTANRYKKTLTSLAFGLLIILLVAHKLHAQYRYSGASGTIGDALADEPSDVINETEFTNSVAGFPFSIRDVRVSFYVIHPADQELSISLVSPDLTEIPLVQNRTDSSGNIDNSVGALGPNFGTGCSESNRTIITDSADATIPLSSAPYVGSFQPQTAYSLAIFAGNSGSHVNGTWALIISDYRHNNIGTLICWTLMIDSNDLIFANGFE